MVKLGIAFVALLLAGCINPSQVNAHEPRERAARYAVGEVELRALRTRTLAPMCAQESAYRLERESTDECVDRYAIRVPPCEADPSVVIPTDLRVEGAFEQYATALLECLTSAESGND